MTGTALILGATGRIGRHAADAFWSAGWTVRRFDRHTDDLDMAAQGVEVIVNGWNPPYPQWAAQVPELTRRVIAAADNSGATVILPGNVYVFGSTTPSPWGPDSPHAATNPLGRIRVEMERAYRASGVKTIIVRAGDYIDTEASGNWFDRVIAKHAAKGVLTAPGDPSALHAWAFLPDVARAMVQLAEIRHRLPPFEDVQMPGFSLSMEGIAQHASAATGLNFRIQRMSWLPLRLLAPFSPMMRHLLEMRYLWSLPHSLDGSRLAEVLPDFRMTEIGTALSLALQHQVDPNQAMARRDAHLITE